MLRQRLVFFTGAGISKESGLSTFRDVDGLWNSVDVKKLASVAGFEENPQAVLDFYNHRRKRLLEVEPNHAHMVLADLEKMHDVTIVTQNVDNLHECAGSSHVIHLHGELTKVTSSHNRIASENIKDYPLDVPIRLGDKAPDGSQLRPYIVCFGEYLGKEVQEAIQHIKGADIFVVIGTSLVVYPASGFVKYAHPEVPKFLIDPSKMEGRLPKGFKHIKAVAVEGVDILVEELKKL